MNPGLWVSQAAAAPTPAEVSAYLLQQGWVTVSANASWAVYSKTLEGLAIEVEAPQQAAAPDYGRAVSLLLDDLGRLEGRPPSSILRDIRSTSTDILRLAIEGSATRDGRISVEAGRRVYGAARDMLLAAACSELDPRAVFATRKPEEAMNLLQQARFGPSEIGSFVLSVECSVSPRLHKWDLFGKQGGDEDAPLPRRTFVRLAKALGALENAARESAASEKIEPFRSNTGLGISANLCDAIAEIIDATSAEALRAGFTFAPRRPLVGAVPRSASFSADTSPILREAARRLREETPILDLEIFGTVVQLDSEEAAAGGEAVVRASIDGRERNVRLNLEPSSYKTAIDAHADRALIRCSGDLCREGRTWVLKSPRGFAVADDGD